MSKSKNDNPQILCMELLEAESEKEIIKILKSRGYWDNPRDWRSFGDKENNWSIIGNQQGNPAAALVEKFVNSIDAVLMMQCFLSGKNPESNQAPQSITEALEEFFDIKNGNLANITASERTILAENIGFIATGRKQTPNYTIFDWGEGQTPAKMPDTLLSLTESNKLRIPFVQGKFNMGGTGVLPFCGRQNFELIISKRHPEIRQSRNDDTADYWGFTIVRREEPTSGRRSSMFTYLAPNMKVPMFQATELKFPDYQYGTQDVAPLEWGTIIKLFEYEMTGFKTNILFDLNYHISLLLLKPGLPIRFFEKRDYEGHSLEATMSGLHVRLQDDRSDNLEEGFPTSHVINVQGEPMTAEVYAFKKGKAGNYRRNEGVVFVINGQTHGSITHRFFSSNRINMGYIADSILVIIEASKLAGRSREDLFMNSRDRVRKGDLYEAIEDIFEELLRSHQGLKNLRERRAREAMENQLADSRPLKEILEKILKKSPSLARLFIQGTDIGNPTRSRLVGEEKTFKGKQHPTFFRIMPKDVSKECHINQRFRAQFETDVEDEYFTRDSYPGKFTLHVDNVLVSDSVLNLVNGIATLTVTLPSDVKVGDTFTYLAKLEDDTFPEPFINEFKRHVADEVDSAGRSPGTRKPPVGDGQGKRQLPDELRLPPMIDVREEDWNLHTFDKYSALRIVKNDGIYNFHINLDNVYLRTELKGLKSPSEIKLLEARFRFALVLIGLALLKDIPNEEDNRDADLSIEQRAASVSKLLAPIILPMIDSLGDLQLEDISDEVESEYVSE